ncbi:MAG: PEGA domain-containing protein [Myxococcales bacterium]
MGTYRTTRITGTREGARLFGVNSLGQAAFLTFVCPPSHPSRNILEHFHVRTPFALAEVAGLVEIAEDDRGVYVVEVAQPSLPLSVVVDRAQASHRPCPPDLAAWMALRVCQISAALPLPHLRLSVRNVFVRPDGEPYVLGAMWARQLPALPEDAPFVPPQPLEDAKLDAFAAAAIARALTGGIEGFPLPIKAALEAASGGPGWAWMLPSREAAAHIEKALGEPAVSTARKRMATWLQSLGLPAQAPVDDGCPTLRLLPVHRLNTGEDSGPLPGGPAMSMDGRLDGQVGRSVAPDPVVDVAPAAVPVAPAEPEPLELDERALRYDPKLIPKGGPAIEAGSMAHKVQAELEDVARRRQTRRVFGVLGVLLLLAAVGVAAGYLRAPSELATFVGSSKETTALLRVESTPSGASVTIAGTPVGETPFVCLNEYEGSTVRVELPGYEPVTQTIGEGTRTLRLVLTRKVGAKPARKP